MEIWSCAFLGQSKFDYEPYQEKILDKIEFLIQRGVTHFYNSYRNGFDALCAAAVDKLREQYPQIKNILVLAHKPEGEFALPDCFDEAVYLQDNAVPTRLAVRNVYRKLVQSVDYLICGVTRGLSDEWHAYNFAKKSLTSYYNVVTDKNYFWIELSPIEIEKAVAEYEERMKVDEEFRTLVEEMARRYEQSLKDGEKQKKKRKHKKTKEYKRPTWVVAKTKKTTEN